MRSQKIKLNRNVEINKLVAMYKSGRILDSKKIATQLVHRYPKDSFIWKALGVILGDLGNHSQALNAKLNAVKYDPNDKEAYKNLGLTQLELGDFKASETSFKAAINIDSNYAEGYFNLGRSLFSQNKYEEANEAYIKAINIENKYYDAWNNLGVSSQAIGKFDEAENYFLNALKIEKNLDSAKLNLAKIYYDQDKTELALNCFSDLKASHNKKISIDSAVYAAILLYLKGRKEDSKAYLDYAIGSEMIENDNLKPSRIYCFYLRRLIEENKDVSNSFIQNLVYVVGESHSLSAHGVNVKLAGKEMICTSRWIQGIKQWHLGNSADNRYKARFKDILNAIPNFGTVMFTIGEIDCRPDEGIFLLNKKQEASSLDVLIESTIVNYISYIKLLTNGRHFNIIINGVPATNLNLSIYTIEEAQKFTNMIGKFNLKLKEESLKSGMNFLDVYAMTNRGDGISNNKWHIDNCHLSSLGFKNACEQFYISSDLNIHH